MTNMRIERDCLGEMEIPNDRYYGIQNHPQHESIGSSRLSCRCLS